MRGVGWKPFFCGTRSRYKTIEIVLRTPFFTAIPIRLLLLVGSRLESDPHEARDDFETTWLASVERER